MLELLDHFCLAKLRLSRWSRRLSLRRRRSADSGNFESFRVNLTSTVVGAINCILPQCFYQVLLCPQIIKMFDLLFLIQ